MNEISQSHDLFRCDREREGERERERGRERERERERDLKVFRMSAEVNTIGKTEKKRRKKDAGVKSKAESTFQKIYRQGKD